MKILVTGSRKKANGDYIFRKLDELINKDKDIIIHGGALGVDSIVEEWCKKNKVKSIIVTAIYPDNGSYYLHRNAEMVGMCDCCIAFWDNVSRGTKFTFKYAQARNKPTDVLIQNGKTN